MHWICWFNFSVFSICRYLLLGLGSANCCILIHCWPPFLRSIYCNENVFSKNSWSFWYCSSGSSSIYNKSYSGGFSPCLFGLFVDHLPKFSFSSGVSFSGYVFYIIHQIYNWIFSWIIHLCWISTAKTKNISCKFNYSHLHT